MRRRFQKGTLIIRGKNPVRCGIYREDVLQASGAFKRVQRCVVLGPVSTVSERAAWKLFQPHLDRVNAAGKLPPKSGITLEQFVKEWRSSVAVNLKGSTTRAAESHLRAHILPKLGSLPLTEISTKTVQSFVAHLATGGRSKKTVENVLLTLSSILRTAKAWDYVCGSSSGYCIFSHPEICSGDQSRISLLATIFRYLGCKARRLSLAKMMTDFEINSLRTGL